MKLAVLDFLGHVDPDSMGAVLDARTWAPQPGVLDAIAQLHHSGWHVVQATNQPRLGHGSMDIGELNVLHQRIQRVLHTAGARIEAFFFCPHTPMDGCSCRKPAVGMLQQIAARYGTEQHEIWVVGQCATHIRSGQALGAHVALVQPPAELACASNGIDAQVPRYASWQALAQALTATPETAAPPLA